MTVHHAKPTTPRAAVACNGDRLTFGEQVH
jgi:hypothetical protein